MWTSVLKFSKFIPQWGYSGLQVTWIIEGFFWVRKFGEYFLGCLEFTRDFLGIQNNRKIRGSSLEVMPAYPYLVVLRRKYNPSWKFLLLGDMAWDFLDSIFGLRIVLGVVGNPRNWVLTFTPFDHPRYLKTGASPNSLPPSPIPPFWNLYIHKCR